ncbi:MAG: acetyl-CoA carboxylase carboxyltransferase subunit alpha [Deltaproteobacteria bacterium]|uniref:Acetyl-coenzyme A carboxylase carboxyl transferase subunit alpha n=1 Tax=Candidatus Zymogenus saltonus TaxID=2844893 RepID=A0A9D8KDM3_9DELT|nr:acetyl-CoA carboxylase carboxyltransferase subunit alpha [Candidatus Zymogenus saltonus]
MNEVKFDRSIRELTRKINEIKKTADNLDGSKISGNVRDLQERAKRLEEDYYLKGDRWMKVEISRHDKRPQMLDYISRIFDGFLELKGDRLYGNDRAVVGGLSRLDEIGVMVIGNHKGRGLKERLERNFGMPHPEGYRKAIRLMKLAERFGIPLITMIDTPGAYPGVEAEERGQSEAIASCMYTMMRLKVPIISVVLGEGGSGGALALGISDRVLMMENANYSVVSPEACASILWKDRKMKKQAAEALKSTAKDNLENGLIDEIVPEPLGGAHRSHKEAADALYGVLRRHLAELLDMDVDRLLKNRYERFRDIGVFSL